MDSRFFQMSTAIIDRQDLNIYEKMCAAVLSRYVGREEFDNLITLEVIAHKMGTSKENAAKAIKSLVAKELLDASDIQIKKAEFEQFAKKTRKTPVKNSSTTKAAPNTLEIEKSEDPKMTSSPLNDVQQEPEIKEYKKIVKTPKNQDHLIQAVFDIIDEKMNEREARIILNFAGNDIELIKEKYKIAKKSQIADKIELLMMELQKKPKSLNSTIKKKEMDDTVVPIPKPPKEENLDGTLLSPPNEVQTQVAYGQLNLNKINKMKVYQEVSNMMKKKD